MANLNNVEFSVVKGAVANPNFKNSDAWTVTIGYEGREMTIPYYMGKGHNGAEPELEMVLESCFLDSSAKDMSFHEWCAEYGYDTDSISNKQTYKACVAIGEQLEEVFGEDLETIEEELQEAI